MALGAQPINIVGAGLAGTLLAVLLARRGLAVHLYERRADPRRASADTGRSINLALAARGIAALERADLMGGVRPLMIAMRGRLVHEPGGASMLRPYGQREHEVIYSIGRAALNRALLDALARYPAAAVHFEHSCAGIRLDEGLLELRDRTAARTYSVPLGTTIAADGAGSTVRTSLVEAGVLSVHEESLDHDYKELTIPPIEGRFALEPHALHVWPRRGFMLIALPNTDASFTATLFLPREGPVSFAALAAQPDPQPFFAREFADATALMPDLRREFREHPQGRLGTVHAHPWHTRAGVLLLGDAAHGIVPFHGQGMNAAFEDCRVLDELLDRGDDWPSVFAEFEAARRPNAEAIARMALENYAEMREHVLDERFQRQRSLALELERRFPDRFIPRYSMVMFHPEISYAEALRRGQVQQEILDALDARTPPGAGFDPDLARALVMAAR
jgi:kynurenine 3-monooxygenase